MKKLTIAFCFLGILTACSEKDPILPGTRQAIFNTDSLKVLNESVEGLPDNIESAEQKDCPYTQDSENIVWKGDKKIFSGFPTSNSVKSTQKPVCSGKYIYVGLTTGELVKLDPATRQIIWIADIYRPSNMTGGASLLDIVAPVIVKGNYVYAGGLGNAFCKLNTQTGSKDWCIDIGTSQPFILTNKAAFVVGTDDNIYAVRLSDGAVYWKTEIKENKPIYYENKILTVGKEKINAETGKIIK